MCVRDLSKKSVIACGTHHTDLNVDRPWGRNELRFYSEYCADESGADNCANVSGEAADRDVAYTHYADGAVQKREKLTVGNSTAVRTDNYEYKLDLLYSAEIVPDSGPTRYEYYGYDVFGARIAKHAYDGDAYFKSVMHDRDFAGRVVAERRRNFDGRADQFLSTYTYGVLGVISRTAEQVNVTTSDNLDYYYVTDAMGYFAGIINTDGTGEFREHDAFGNRRGSLILLTSGYYRPKMGSYMWRGGEGSSSDIYTDQDDEQYPINESPVTTQSTGLVHMGVRYYEPETGRFTQRDPVTGGNPLSFNPYVYSENDPINFSDPNGTDLLTIAAIIVLILIVAIVLFNIFNFFSYVYQGFLCWVNNASLKQLKQYVRQLKWMFIGGAAVAGGLSLGIGAAIFGLIALGLEIAENYIGDLEDEVDDYEDDMHRCVRAETGDGLFRHQRRTPEDPYLFNNLLCDLFIPSVERIAVKSPSGESISHC